MRFIVHTVPDANGDAPNLEELCDSLLEMLSSENPLDLCGGFFLKRVVAESVSDRKLLTVDDHVPSMVPAMWFMEA